MFTLLLVINEPLHTQYLHSIYTVSTEYLHSIYTVSTQYLHSIYTLRPPDGHDGGVVVVLHLEVLYLRLEVCLLQHAALHPVQLARSAPGRAQREPAPAGAELPTKLREVFTFTLLGEAPC